MVSSEDQPDYDSKPVHPVRTKQRSPFTITPKAVRIFARDKRDGDITQVYATLADYANADGVCWPSQATIADEAGVSLRKVISVLRLLHEAGFICAEHGQHRNTYTLLDVFPDAPTVQDLQSDTTSTVQDLHPTVQNLHVTVQESTPHCAENDIQTRTSKQDPVEPDPVKPDSYSARTNEIVRWFAKRVGGVVAKPGSKPWECAHDLAEAGATDADLEGTFVWLQGEAWVKSISLTLMAAKFNDYKSRHATPIKPVDDENPKLKGGMGLQSVRERKRLVLARKGCQLPSELPRYDERIAEIDATLIEMGVSVQEAEAWALRH